MCLAIPMRVNEIHGEQDDPLSFPVAVVDENGLRKEVRLDVVDRWPHVGDYIIVHAGFAIHTLDPSEAETNLKLSEREKELVIGLGGGYPFFTQMAGHYLVDAKWKGFEEDAFLKDVVANFDAQSDSHFTYMWSHSSESEKITLLAVISLNRQKPSKNSIPNLENLAKIHSRAHLDVPELVKRGLLLENRLESTFSLLSPSLERWIAREIYAVPGEEPAGARERRLARLKH